MKQEKMPSGKQLCQILACFAIGGIITVMFMKILEWRGSQKQEQAADERRMIVAVQEVGNAERQDERIVQGYTVKIKFPREQDDL